MGALAGFNVEEVVGAGQGSILRRLWRHWQLRFNIEVGVGLCSILRRLWGFNIEEVQGAGLGSILKRL